MKTAKSEINQGLEFFQGLKFYAHLRTSFAAVPLLRLIPDLRPASLPRRRRKGPGSQSLGGGHACSITEHRIMNTSTQSQSSAQPRTSSLQFLICGTTNSISDASTALSSLSSSCQYSWRSISSITSSPGWTWESWGPVPSEFSGSPLQPHPYLL